MSNKIYKHKRDKQYLKENRQVDWAKVRKSIKYVPLGLLMLFIVIFFYLYGAVNKHNSIRKKVLSNPITTEAAVTKIYHSENSNYAVFEFWVNGQHYTGQTFYGYTGDSYGHQGGDVGDKLCVTYNKTNPAENIYCEDSRPETFRDDILFESLKMFGVIMIGTIAIVPIILAWEIIRGNKKLIAELTSKRN